MAACCFSGLAKLAGATQLDTSMPKKFTYFGLKTPVGLPSMCLLEISGTNYEGKAIGMEEWAALKPKTPGGQLPVADMPDGTTIQESGAIGRTIAGAAGLLGTGKSFSQSEMVVGIASDMNKKYSEIAPTVFTVDAWKQKGGKNMFAEKKSELEGYITKLDKLLMPGGDRFTSSGLTYGEVYLFCVLDCHANGAYPEAASGCLKKFYDRMAKVPGIKTVLDGKSKFGALGPYMIPCP